MNYDNIKQKILDRAVLAEKINKPIVYALIKDGEIVYVGQTRKGIVRILAHVNDKDFDSYSIMEKDFFNEDDEALFNEWLEIYEEELIVRLNPKLNSSIKGYLFCNMSVIQKMYELSRWKVSKILKGSNIKRYIFNSKVYYYADDVCPLFEGQNND
jgi:hypothetical protein